MWGESWKKIKVAAGVLFHPSNVSMDSPTLQEAEPIKLRVSNQKAYLWDLNGTRSQTSSLNVPRSIRLTLSCRHSEAPRPAPHLWLAPWYPPPGDPTERVSGFASCSRSRRSRLARQEPYVTGSLPLTRWFHLNGKLTRQSRVQG